MAMWTLKHDDETVPLMQSKPRDLRGLKFIKGCGYLWVNKNDGNGWLQTSLLIRREQIRVAVAA